MEHRTTLAFLCVSGVLLLGIGGLILFVPHAFYAGNGIALGEDPSLLSEVRASGGLLAVSGLLVLLGVVRVRLRALAATLVVLVYGSFGLSRLLALALDGLPSSGVIGATAFELVVAAVGLVVLNRQSGTSLSDASHHHRSRFGAPTTT